MASIGEDRVIGILSEYNSLSRSYICRFWLKGFSNAQALGEHMTIHRRVRANLIRRKLMEDNKDDGVIRDKCPTSDIGRDP
ncbi:hypothetical protein YC2023_068359 [Brassica napus]